MAIEVNQVFSKYISWMHECDMTRQLFGNPIAAAIMLLICIFVILYMHGGYIPCKNVPSVILYLFCIICGFQVIHYNLMKHDFAMADQRQGGVDIIGTAEQMVPMQNSIVSQDVAAAQPFVAPADSVPDMTHDIFEKYGIAK
jgi:hypothetical protein